MDSLKSQVSGSAAEWAAAGVRVDEYLRALGVADPVRRAQRVAQLVRPPPVDVTQHPTTLAMDAAQLALERWLQANLAGLDLSPTRRSVQGRLAVVIAQVPERWPDAFLAESPAPAEVRQALHAVALRPAPEWRPAHMVPQPVEVNPLAAEAWGKMEGIVLLEVVTVTSGVLAALWLLFHLIW